MVGRRDDTLATVLRFALRGGAMARDRPAAVVGCCCAGAPNAALKPLRTDDDMSHAGFARSVRTAGAALRALRGWRGARCQAP